MARLFCCCVKRAGALAALLLVASLVVRADLERGVAAYKAGDFAAALREFRESAEAGEATAMFSLGFLYLRGEGVDTNYQEAVHWLALAAERGVAPAQHSLALLYYEGRGVKRNSAVAANYFESAALQGLADAQFNLGVLYSRGDGVEQDWARAMFWHRKAAEQGVTDSQLAVGVMYANGQGVDRDYVEAGRWLGMAAAGGNQRARRMLETAFGDPRDVGARRKPSSEVPQSGRTAAPPAANPGLPHEANPPATSNAKAPAPAEVLDWRPRPGALTDRAFQELQARAVAGDGESRMRLAILYYHGVSTEQSPVRAYVWAELAAAQGQPKADEFAAELKKTLSARQRGAARAILNEWQKDSQ